MPKPTKPQPINLKKLQPHKLGEAFPPMDDVAYKALVQGMKDNGFDDKHPIVLHEGKILDGNHRYTAAQKAKVEPSFVNFKDGLDPIEFVMQENLRRRHLSPSQSAALGAELAEMIASRDKAAKAAEKEAAKAAKANGKAAPAKAAPTGRATAKAAKVVGVSERSVTVATAVKKASKKEFAAVKAGDKSLNAAEKAVKDKKTSAEKKGDEYQAALAKIGTVCGKGLPTAVTGRMKPKDVLEMSELENERMKTIYRLVTGGFTLKAALGWKPTQLVPANTIRQLLDLAVAGGGKYLLEIKIGAGEFTIEVNQKL